MIELKVIATDGESIYLKCSSSDKTYNEYAIRGYDSHKTYSTILTSNKPDIKLERNEIFSKFEHIVCYASNDEDTDISNKIDVNLLKPSSLGMKILISYNGYAVSFQHPCMMNHKNPICDEYRLYGFKNGKKKLIKSDSEFLTHIKSFSCDEYKAEGYRKDEDGNTVLIFESRNIPANVLLDEANAKINTAEQEIDFHSTDLVIMLITNKNENNIARVLDSMLLSKQAIPIIIVNDVTDDKTKAICKWYAKRYPMIIYDNDMQPKEKCGPAKCAKIAHTICEQRFKPTYVGFASTDCIIHPDNYQAMLSYAKSSDADIIESRIYIHYKDTDLILPEQNGFTVQTQSSQEEIFKNQSYYTNCMADCLSFFIMKNSIVRTTPFPDTSAQITKLGCDVCSIKAYIMTILAKARKISTIMNTLCIANLQNEDERFKAEFKNCYEACIAWAENSLTYAFDASKKTDYGFANAIFSAMLDAEAIIESIDGMPNYKKASTVIFAMIDHAINKYNLRSNKYLAPQILKTYNQFVEQYSKPDKSVLRKLEETKFLGFDS